LLRRRRRRRKRKREREREGALKRDEIDLQLF